TQDSEIKIASVQALGSVGGPLSIPTILDAYHSEDWRIAAKAATALGEMGDNSVLDELAAGLTHRVWWVRRNSAAALAALPGGIAVLYRSLTSPDPFARDSAAEALDDCGELVKARTRHEQGEANRDELRLLRHMRGSEAVPA
ncbi:MAG: HEAT repeat domain-containing protein, partial [Acidimicrobiia bacterium]|nr:HEAT repeat domain-containing protein [Acidimicrobiia bacterium]